MKKAIAVMLSLFLLSALTSCTNSSSDKTSSGAQSSSPQSSSTAPPQNTSVQITVQVGEYIYSAELYESEAAKVFANMLPLTVRMSELNGNEKFWYMDDSLPVQAQSVGTINSGDIMLFGDNCLVIFYDTFQTSYQYTPLGKITDTAGLVDALGTGDVQVTFSLS